MTNSCQLESSCLKTAVYDHDARILQLTFQSGQVSDYHDVDFDVFIGLIDAESAGKYFRKFIRNGYHCERIQIERGA